MNKTVYLRDEDVPIWEKARELANDKLSPIIVAALRDFVARTEAEAKGYERILLEFNDENDNKLPKAKAFYGRWIIDTKSPLTLDDESGTERDYYSVAETAKGNIVIFTHTENQDSVWNYRMLIYPSFHDAATKFNYVIREAMERRGIPVEELDI